MGLLRDDFRIGGFKVIIRLQSAVLQGPQNLVCVNREEHNRWKAVGRTIYL